MNANGGSVAGVVEIVTENGGFLLHSLLLSLVLGLLKSLLADGQFLLHPTDLFFLFLELAVVLLPSLLKPLLEPARRDNKQTNINRTEGPLHIHCIHVCVICYN